MFQIYEKEQNDQYTTLKGITASLESKDGIITQTVTIDYSVAKVEDLKKFGSRAEVGKFREARFEKVGELLIIKLNSDKNDSVRAVRI